MQAFFGVLLKKLALFLKILFC